MMLFRCLKPAGLFALALTVATPAVALGDDKVPPPTKPNGERPPVREPRNPAEGGREAKPGNPNTPPDAGKPRGEGRRGAKAPERAGGLVAWIAVVKQLELTSDQTAKIDAHVAEFQAAQQAWMQENGTKAKALEAKSREEKKNGDLSEATKKELAELNATRPSPPQVQEKITALLTVEQKAALETKLAEARAAAQEKKNEQARKRRDAERGNGKSDVGTGGGSGREGGKGRTGK